MILDKFRHAAGAAAGIAAIALLTDCATHSGAATAPSQPHRTSVACRRILEFKQVFAVLVLWRI